MSPRSTVSQATLGTVIMCWAVSVSAQVPCVGDCSDDNSVTVDEIVTGVNIALGQTDISVCQAFDSSGDGSVTVDELLTAVTNALNGCPPIGPVTTFPTSLHALRTGKKTFYSADNGGFENISGIPYEQLDCRGCHAPTYADGTPVDPVTYEPGCADCHADLSNPSQGINDMLCFGCHSRQAAEASSFPDVHRDAGFTCISCHTKTEIHGDGTEYLSHLDTPGPQCEECHDADGPGPVPPSNTAHSIHIGKLDCSTCHVKSVITCYNCHFESELAGGGKRFFAPPRRDFKLLLNFRGKVYPGTFQSLVYQGQSFYVLAPYYSHAVTTDISCSDCHNNAAIREYSDTGAITVTEYREGVLQGPSGVIPVPPDWETALKLDFLDYTGDASDPQTDAELWRYLKTGADLTQMLYGTPLTSAQINRLKLNVGGAAAE